MKYDGDQDRKSPDGNFLNGFLQDCPNEPLRIMNTASPKKTQVKKPRADWSNGMREGCAPNAPPLHYSTTPVFRFTLRSPLSLGCIRRCTSLSRAPLAWV